jgi:hypothetical protein
MELTPEQRNTLLSQKRTADHMFRWVYDVLNSKKISVKQYNVLIKIHDMTAMDQAGYIIHEDTLYPVPRKVKRYQKTVNGWKFTKRYSGITKSRRKDK